MKQITPQETQNIKELINEGKVSINRLYGTYRWLVSNLTTGQNRDDESNFSGYEVVYDNGEKDILIENSGKLHHIEEDRLISILNRKKVALDMVAPELFKSGEYHYSPEFSPFSVADYGRFLDIPDYLQKSTIEQNVERYFALQDLKERKQKESQQLKEEGAFVLKYQFDAKTLNPNVHFENVDFHKLDEKYQRLGITTMYQSMHPRIKSRFNVSMHDFISNPESYEKEIQLSRDLFSLENLFLKKHNLTTSFDLIELQNKDYDSIAEKIKEFKTALDDDTFMSNLKDSQRTSFINPEQLLLDYKKHLLQKEGVGISSPAVNADGIAIQVTWKNDSTLIHFDNETLETYVGNSTDNISRDDLSMVLDMVFIDDDFDSTLIGRVLSKQLNNEIFTIELKKQDDEIVDFKNIKEVMLAMQNNYPLKADLSDLEKKVTNALYTAFVINKITPKTSAEKKVGQDR